MDADLQGLQRESRAPYRRGGRRALQEDEERLLDRAARGPGRTDGRAQRAGTAGADGRSQEGVIAMPTVKKSIEVNVPVRIAYDQWTQFEEFPRFMEGVESVQQLDDKRLHWRGEGGGKGGGGGAEDNEQGADKIIAGRGASGARHQGIVGLAPPG